MKVLFIQSSDLAKYRPLIEVTSRTIIEYCARRDYQYSCFMGIIKGNKPWHAALNRISMLKALSQSGYDSWVIYVDADAYIADLEFDLEGYLANFANVALLAAGSGFVPQKWWDINNGVFALNFKHSGAHEIVDRWSQKLDLVDNDALHNEGEWGQVVDDQTILQIALQEIQAVNYVQIDTMGVLNYGGRFIRQVLRAGLDFERRLNILRSAVAQVMKDPVDKARNNPFLGDNNLSLEELVKALYKVLLGREADPQGLSDAANALRFGKQDFEAQIRSTCSSEEFRQKLPEFILRYSQ